VVPTADLSIALDVTQTGKVAASGATGRKSVVIKAGKKSAAFAVDTADDKADEPDGAIAVAVVKGSGYAVGAPGSATVTVADDDPTAVTLTGKLSAACPGSCGTRARPRASAS